MSSLQESSVIMGKRKAKHFLRRLTFNYSKAQITHFATLTPRQAMDLIKLPAGRKIAEPYDPLPSASPDGYWTLSAELPTKMSGQARKDISVTGWYFYNAHNTISLQYKMIFFLHTCFTVSKGNGTGAGTYFYDHLRLLDHFSLGSLKEMAKKVSFDHAMLNYLDNNTNVANNPNENYAREFLELFTILKGPQKGAGDYTNYQELDIQQAAKVFSGIRNQNDRSIIDPDTGIPKGYVLPNRHDQLDKKFSSAFNEQIIKGGSSEAEIEQEVKDFVDMIFNQKATAVSYCRKLYRFFVKSEWDDEVEMNVIQPLADLLIVSDYQILPVLERLFTSQHFFDEDDTDPNDQLIGAIVKNPLQLVGELLSFFEVELPVLSDSDTLKEYYLYFYRNFIHNSCFEAAGFSPFSPDSVAGYPGVYQSPDYDRHWFSSTSIVARYKYFQSMIAGKNLIAGWGKFESTIDTVGWVKRNISDPSDPDLLVNDCVELLFCELPSDQRKTHFKAYLIENYDNSYWTAAWVLFESSSDDTTVRIRLDEFFTALVNAAEFQLM